MHELALCRSIARIAEQHRAGRGVERVGVRLGALRQAVPEALERCWSVVTRGTGLAGSALVFEIVPLVVRCTACGSRTRLREVWLRCDACGSVDVDVVAGDEFVLTYLDLADDAGCAVDAGRAARPGGGH
ncbi:hydrogenase maturation nickel metallochaperone HypA [Xylanimonas allomyrinae]|uniref:Hydrogenase maturation factor HypA n=1 Tax=Xylanimonas allomyrinae TaxID=2509459 RepID=A0A4P6EUL0_9MICO|nr:hydrogenase maturation nickel metallochaperone HypA [Xylanimonas allomyrinae]QAY64137.1 hydrogenase maturation nickel metallochaperone HypA [Xylanimonas allomyrinae]